MHPHVANILCRSMSLEEIIRFETAKIVTRTENQLRMTHCRDANRKTPEPPQNSYQNIVKNLSERITESEYNRKNPKHPKKRKNQAKSICKTT